MISSETAQKYTQLTQKFNMEEKKTSLVALSKQMQDPALWHDVQKAKEVTQAIHRLQKKVEEFEMMQLLYEEGEESELSKMLLTHETLLLFSGQYDDHDVIFTIHAGQGGTEAMDWTQMLYRMYSKYCQIKGWKIEMVDEIPGEEAGLKTITINVHGEYAYGHLKAEAGTHRLVRLSPFNSSNLRQTSFALVEAFPILKETAVEIKESDLQWQFFRSGGHGGQNVNKVATAVRLTHTPSGIIVTCQQERSQQQNRLFALQILRGKLWQKEESERMQKEKTFKKNTMASWGTQIRSYVLHPYQMVKDLRTDLETSNTERVLNGDIDDFIKAYLLKFS